MKNEKVGPIPTLLIFLQLPNTNVTKQTPKCMCIMPVKAFKTEICKDDSAKILPMLRMVSVTSLD